MNFPISFDSFKKDPIKGILFLCVIAIMYLYIDNRMGYTSQIEKQDERIEKLEGYVLELQNKLISTATAAKN
jgi:hypothetical protein